MRVGYAAVLLLAGCATARPAPDPAVMEVPFRVVMPAVAFEMLRDNPGLFIFDLRSPPVYRGEIGHLNRAVNIPLAELEARLGELAHLRRRTFLVTCDNSPCGPEGMLVLRENGFRFPVLLAGGVAHWKRAGFGVVHGPDPEPRPSEEEADDAAASPAESASSVDISGKP